MSHFFWRDLIELQRDAVVKLLAYLSIKKADGSTASFSENSSNPGSYALGLTKVFIRYPIALFTLENLRLQAIPKIVFTIERAFQRYRVSIHSRGLFV